MKKMFFQFIFVYAFSLIVAILLLIFKSRISEGDYHVVQLVLFGYSVLKGMVFFIPRFTVWLLKKIFKNSAFNPDEYPKGSISWPCIVLLVFILDVFFGWTLIIPIAIIIQSSYILYELVKNKTLILGNPE